MTVMNMAAGVTTIVVAVLGVLGAMYLRSRRAHYRRELGERRYRVRWGRKEETCQQR